MITVGDEKFQMKIVDAYKQGREYAELFNLFNAVRSTTRSIIKKYN